MTTDNENRIIELTAGIIEDTAIGHEEEPDFEAKAAAKRYVYSVLDNGWVSSSDDTPVWELVELLGHDRNDMDSLRVYHQLAALIDAVNV